MVERTCFACEETYQALPAFPYYSACKRRKAGQGLGTRLMPHQACTAAYATSSVPMSRGDIIMSHHRITHGYSQGR